jgi:tetratricopeptide (TPR) repeat protein
VLAQTDPAATSALMPRALVNLAGVRSRQGRLADCASAAADAARLAEEAGDRSSLARAYLLLDAAYTDLGDPRTAEYRGSALPIFEELGDLLGQANAANNLGINAYYEGRWEESLAYYGRSRDAYRRAGNVVDAAIAANNIAEILSDQGAVEEAVAMFEEALVVFDGAGFVIGATLARSNLGRAFGRAGKFEDALAMLAEAHAAFLALGSETYVLEVQARQAEVLLDVGRVVEAYDLAAAVAARAAGVANHALLAMAHRLRGVALARTGSAERADGCFGESLAAARAVGAMYEEGLTLLAAADFAPDPDAARAAAAAVLRPLGVRPNTNWVERSCLFHDSYTQFADDAGRVAHHPAVPIPGDAVTSGAEAFVADLVFDDVERSVVPSRVDLDDVALRIPEEVDRSDESLLIADGHLPVGFG